jgi:hypothetical protein
MSDDRYGPPSPEKCAEYYRDKYKEACERARKAEGELAELKARRETPAGVCDRIGHIYAYQAVGFEEYKEVSAFRHPDGTLDRHKHKIRLDHYFCSRCGSQLTTRREMH